MSVRRARRIPESGHAGPDERWMASYLDMVTVLMCMFIVMFAMSTVDQEKFEALRASLATGFGSEISESTDVSEGVIVPPELVDEAGEGFTELQPNAAQQEYDSLADLRTRLQEALDARGLGDAATFTIDDRGLTVGLVSAETFFATNSTVLSDKARAVLDAAGGVLVTVPNQISVEGHADFRQPAPPFVDNWQLSSERATGVLRYLVDARTVPQERVSSVGYGASRPMAEGTATQALAMNRRVDIVVLSEATEEVRSMLPGLAAADASG
ncbi:flagellar motor protein MotB [Microbacterium sp. zg.Y1090]|uniref:OmpA/MotB family protein n=1 Tax=Microbacterium wangruii TaxID=3049073 RepID=UPI00214D6DB6|nr:MULTISPECIES: flagellar motor protein MotB [unclassified Microbacterium]MCR2819262.1 flagellar motor protein MotB [Microbacterium sp. zg.Y1090]WIM28244.1 flagellar motor protein MotB [Microbacterium sp. zg-Y1090]